MTRDDIEKWQAKKIRDALSPAGNYLARLRERMEKRGFPPRDQMYQLTCAAHEAVQRLWMRVHYLSCGGTGHPFGKDASAAENSDHAGP
jgi:hypothetical protein